jgi:hypothetical protein
MVFEVDPVPPDVNTSQQSSGFSWSTAFKSPEFMIGLQTAVSHVLNQGSTPTERASQLEMMGNQSQAYTRKEIGQVGDAIFPFLNSLRHPIQSLPSLLELHLGSPRVLVTCVCIIAHVHENFYINYIFE